MISLAKRAAGPVTRAGLLDATYPLDYTDYLRTVEDDRRLPDAEPARIDREPGVKRR